MPAFPASLPSRPQSYNEDFPENTIRTNMDTGPAKVRKRQSAGTRPFICSYILDSTEVATLDTFFVTTVESGALSFTMDNPRTGSNETFRMSEPPKVSGSGPLFNASIRIEKLP